jgi:hypothetical protein
MDAGIGNWPKPPTWYKRGEVVDKGVATIKPNSQHSEYIVQIAPKLTKAAWRKNARELFYRARSECRMAHAEASLTPMYYEQFPDLDTAESRLKTFKNRVKDNSKSGREGRLVWTLYAYEVEDVLNFVIVHNHEKEGEAYGSPLPLDRAGAMTLFLIWADTPEDFSIRRSRNRYGGVFNNVRGDGRKRAAAGVAGEAAQEQEEKQERSKVQILQILASDIHTLADCFRIPLNENLYGEKVIPADEIFEAIRKASTKCPDLRAKGGKDALKAFYELEGIPPNVSTNSPNSSSSSSADVMGGNSPPQHEPAPPADMTEAQKCFDLVFGDSKWTYR